MFYDFFIIMNKRMYKTPDDFLNGVLYLLIAYI